MRLAQSENGPTWETVTKLGLNLCRKAGAAFE